MGVCKWEVPRMTNIEYNFLSRSRFWIFLRGISLEPMHRLFYLGSVMSKDECLEDAVRNTSKNTKDLVREQRKTNRLLEKILDKIGSRESDRDRDDRETEEQNHDNELRRQFRQFGRRWRILMDISYGY